MHWKQFCCLQYVKQKVNTDKIKMRKHEKNNIYNGCSAVFSVYI